jgi:hypothetical protein
MPLLPRTRSSPDGKIASSHLEDQFVHTSDQPSTWLRAPTPARFVRKQNKEGKKGQPDVSSKNTHIHRESSISATVEIDADVWTFANNPNSPGRAHKSSTQSKYYLAHRQHVAEELTKAETVPTTRVESSNELWDGFLRVLSV